MTYAIGNLFIIFKNKFNTKQRYKKKINLKFKLRSPTKRLTAGPKNS